MRVLARARLCYTPTAVAGYAVGPVDPEVAPLDPSNNTTSVVIDVIDKNDF